MKIEGWYERLVAGVDKTFNFLKENIFYVMGITLCFIAIERLLKMRDVVGMEGATLDFVHDEMVGMLKLMMLFILALLLLRIPFALIGRGEESTEDENRNSFDNERVPTPRFNDPSESWEYAKMNQLLYCTDCERFTRWHLLEQKYLEAQLERRPVESMHVCPNCGSTEISESNADFSWLDTHRHCPKLTKEGFYIAVDSKKKVEENIQKLKDLDAFVAYERKHAVAPNYRTDGITNEMTAGRLDLKKLLDESGTGSQDFRDFMSNRIYVDDEKVEYTVLIDGVPYAKRRGQNDLVRMSRWPG